MLDKHTVCAVVPAYNVEHLIGRVIDTMPEVVDKIVVIDDSSRDGTKSVIERYAAQNPKVVLIAHSVNQGVGGAIATGYEWARDNNFDVAVVMAGDAQMDPADMPAILEPIVSGRADYSKGNRLFSGQAFQKIPKSRYFGNAGLSFLTKIASGYWHIADSQSGYTAINKAALHAIDWKQMYRRYGQPNDILVRLNIHNFRVADVPIEPLYNVGEKSGIRIRIVIFTISWLLLRMFARRLGEKYVIKNFHPLVLFYAIGTGALLSTALLFVRLFYYWGSTGSIPPINALAAMFSALSASQFLLFAMWFDMEENRKLAA